MRFPFIGWLVLATVAPVYGGSIFVPNASFEFPDTDLASPSLGSWQKSPQPFWYDEPMFPWAAFTGQFLNTTNGSPNHVDNLDGKQAAYLFAQADVAIFQDYNSMSGTNATPSREFNAQFEVGRSYTLTVGVLGGGGGMSNGVPLTISVYYRDLASNMVTVSSTTITNTAVLFPTNTHFTDFQVNVSTVKASDAWAGKRIGIKLASGLTLADSALFGGYWDVDNVRLTESVVPNHSFESPVTDLAAPFVDSWQKSEQPGWYDEPSFPWFAVTGQFLNTSNGSPNHIDNLEGSQGAYLFALPDVALFQDYNSIGGFTSSPTHEFDAKYEVGKAYALTVGVLGGGGGMSNGATFQISMYYRDDASNAVTVASTTITNTPALFPTNTHFTDFQARVPQVKPGQAWAGRNIGIKLASGLTVAEAVLKGGYWDIDNVRLTESVLPNHSFESPETDLAAPFVDSWEKSAQPAWYNDPDFPWFAVAGQFLNTSSGSPNHIDNVEGEQAAYLFALPDVALFQDYISIGGLNPAPTHEFSLKYERGNSYNLTVGVLGAGGSMSNGVTFIMSFYYRDDASNRVIVASTTVTNSTALFPTNTHLIDFQVQVPTVLGREPWAGRSVGVQLASGLTLADRALSGGYWDVDNVRLNVVCDPVLKDVLVNTNQEIQFTLTSAPGRYEVLSSADGTLPSSGWTSLGIVTNVSGSVSLTDTNLANRFYRARTSP